MRSFPFLPAAVQTPFQGELPLRRQVRLEEIPHVKKAARKAGIVYRSIRVTSQDGPVTYWAFSNRSIHYAYSYPENSRSPRRKGAMAS